MHLTLSPIRGLPEQAETVLSVAGDVLTVDGVAADFSVLNAGDEATIEGGPFVGPIRRIGGAIHATVAVILGDTAAPDQPDSPWTVNADDGPVTIPAARVEAQPDQEEQPQ